MRCVVFAVVTTLACGRISFDQNDAGDAVDDRDQDGMNGELASSCSALRTADRSLPDGVYEVDFDGAGPGVSRRVYCNMTIVDGGWTLVGRSRANAPDGPFGWSAPAGSVDDDSEPYSLGPAADDLGFTEILVASHAGSKEVADRAFVVAVAAGFIAARATTSHRSESSTILGTCDPDPFVTMLLFKGQTDLPGVFWFRDVEFVGATPHGLFPHGWDTYYAGDCLQGGLMHETQGLIFVR